MLVSGRVCRPDVHQDCQSLRLRFLLPLLLDFGGKVGGVQSQTLAVVYNIAQVAGGIVTEDVVEQLQTVY